jgi:hypothetical protein
MGRRLFIAGIVVAALPLAGLGASISLARSIRSRLRVPRRRVTTNSLTLERRTAR